MLPVYAGEIQCKCLGVEVDIFNIKGNSTSDKGELVIGAGTDVSLFY